MDRPVITITGTYRQPDDTPATGTVVLELVAPYPHTADPRLVTQGPVVATLDDHGHFTTSVVASDDPGWGGGAHIPYRVIRRVGSGRMAISHVYLDGPGPVDLTQVAPIDHAGGRDPWWATIPTSPGLPGGWIEGDVLQISGGGYDWTDNLVTALNRTNDLQTQVNDLRARVTALEAKTP